MYPGMFLGYHTYSNSYLILNEEGKIVKSRALQRRPFPDRWRAEELQACVATPWSWRGSTIAKKVELGEKREKAEQPQADPVTNPRRLKITLKTLADHGVTDGCPQCQHVQRYNEAKPGLAHSLKCRGRTMKSMRGPPEDAERIERYESRVDRAWEAMGERDTIEQNGIEDAAPVHDREERDGGREGAEDVNIADDIRVPEGGIGGAGVNEDMDMGLVMLIMHLRPPPRGYRRKHRHAVKRLVSQVYSPPRVTRMLSLLPPGLLHAGLAFDITRVDPDDGLPWDFGLRARRDKVFGLLREQTPLFLIGSPM